MASSSNFEVVAVGNINIDLVFLTPRYPGRDEETLAKGFFVSHGGSAANFAVGVSRLGIKCAMVGCVGGDHFGKTAIDALKGEGVGTEGVLVCDTGTGIVCVIVDGEHRSMIAWRGANAKILEAVRQRGIGTPRLVHVSNVSKEVLSEVVGRKAGAKVSFDPGGAAVEFALEDLHGVDLLFLNESELAILLGGCPQEEILEVVETVVVKKGPKGAALLTEGVEVSCPAFSVNVVDTTGAGDAFDAAFVAALMRGRSPKEALVWGCGGAALKIQSAGARGGLPSLKQLMVLLGSE